MSLCVLDVGSMTSAEHAIFCTNTMAMSSYIFKDKAKHNDNVLIFKQVWLFLFVMQASCFGFLRI